MVQIVSVIGAIIILAAYAGVQIGRLDPMRLPFSLANAAGVQAAGARAGADDWGVGVSLRRLIAYAVLTVALVAAIALACEGRGASADHVDARWGGSQVNVAVDYRFNAAVIAHNISGWNASPYVTFAVVGIVDCDGPHPFWGRVTICPLAEDWPRPAVAGGAMHCQQQYETGQPVTEPTCWEYRSAGGVGIKLSALDDHDARSLICHEFGHTLGLHDVGGGPDAGCMTGVNGVYRCPGKQDLDHMNARYSQPSQYVTVAPPEPALYPTAPPGDCIQRPSAWWVYACGRWGDNSLVAGACRGYGL